MDGIQQTYGARLGIIRVDFTSPEGQRLARRYQVRGHPTIVIIDRAGVAQDVIIGVAGRERLERAVVAVLSGET